MKRKWSNVTEKTKVFHAKIKYVPLVYMYVKYDSPACAEVTLDGNQFFCNHQFRDN